VNKAALRSGSSIGPYQLTEIIGEGAFSKVWSAWDTRLNRVVAVKIIPHSEVDVSGSAAFGREAAIIARLEHPHILPLHDFGETAEYHYLVTRYVTGGAMTKRLEREPLLPIPEVLRLMSMLATALDYIHEQKIVHRDLKPGNVLLDIHGMPYLTDFGLAKPITNASMQHSIAGTFNYMSPEQFSGSAISLSTDMYSFGIMLYQMFAGILPFRGEVALGARQLYNNEKLPDITNINPNLPAGLNDYLWSLTDPDPAARPLGAVAVMTSIMNLLQTSTSQAASPSVTIRLALDSGAYREQEARALIEQALSGWREDVFRLSLTDFVLLDETLSHFPGLFTEEVASLMLRGAIQFNQQIDKWWDRANDKARERACQHALMQNNETAILSAMRLWASRGWSRRLDVDILRSVAQRMMTMPDMADTALDFFERVLPIRLSWIDDTEDPNNKIPEVDAYLQSLAISGNEPQAQRAARLIGQARRTHAALSLPTSFQDADPLLIAFETAGSLPNSIPVHWRLIFALLLAVRQLTRNPINAAMQLLWTVAGNVVAMSLMLYSVGVERAVPGSNWLIVNTIGFGLLFGLIYGFGVWLSRHIGLRLSVAPYLLRTLISIAAGGLIMAAGFNTFQRFQYDGWDLEPTMAISSGVLYVLGYVMSVRWRWWLQMGFGTAGFMAAFLIPWQQYVDFVSYSAPLLFSETNPSSALGLTFAAGSIASAMTVGYLWWQRSVRSVRRVQEPKTIYIPSQPSNQTANQPTKRIVNDIPSEIIPSDTTRIPPAKDPSATINLPLQAASAQSESKSALH
jgi:serine/threonine protein kinase